MANPYLDFANAALNAMEGHGKALGFDNAKEIAAQRELVSKFSTPEQFRQWAAGHAASAEKLLPTFQTRNLGGTTDTLAIDPVTGVVRVTNSATNTATPGELLQSETTRRGQNMTDARAREGNEIQRQAARTQVVDAENGPVLVDKGTRSVFPLATPDGQPLGKPLKQIPPTVNTAIIQNNQSLNQLDRALTLLEGNNIGDPKNGGQQGDKAATGWKGYLPGVVLNRVDPKGVDARAEVADVGSLKIHDRSGAAVTISEAPRLMPFVPQATDDADTVKKKLRRLRTELQNESNALQQTYGKDQGYRPNPVNAGSGPRVGQVEDGFRYKGGDPKDRNSWEKV